MVTDINDSKLILYVHVMIHFDLQHDKPDYASTNQVHKDTDTKYTQLKIKKIRKWHFIHLMNIG